MDAGWTKARGWLRPRLLAAADVLDFLPGACYGLFKHPREAQGRPGALADPRAVPEAPGSGGRRSGKPCFGPSIGAAARAPASARSRFPATPCAWSAFRRDSSSYPGLFPAPQCSWRATPPTSSMVGGTWAAPRDDSEVHELLNDPRPAFDRGHLPAFSPSMQGV